MMVNIFYALSISKVEQGLTRIRIGDTGLHHERYVWAFQSKNHFIQGINISGLYLKFQIK